MAHFACLVLGLFSLAAAQGRLNSEPSARRLRGQREEVSSEGADEGWSFWNPDPEVLVWDEQVLMEEGLPSYFGWLKTPLVHDMAMLPYEEVPEGLNARYCRLQIPEVENRLHVRRGLTKSTLGHIGTHRQADDLVHIKERAHDLIALHPRKWKDRLPRAVFERTRRCSDVHAMLFGDHATLVQGPPVEVFVKSALVPLSVDVPVEAQFNAVGASTWATAVEQQRTFLGRLLCCRNCALVLPVAQTGT